MAIELPKTPPDKIQLCASMAAASMAEVANEERDSAPVYFVPGIGVYTS